MECINCKYEHDFTFCPNCGEESKTEKITFSSIFKSGLSTITSMNKGFLYVVKSLFLNPSKLVNEYIKGRRKNIYNPVAFLIVSITLYLVIDSFIFIKPNVVRDPSKAYSFGYEIGRFLKSYLKYFWILSIFWLSTSTRLLFKKYNYAEHLAINSFVIGQSTLVGLIIFSIFKITLLFNPLVYISILWLTYAIFKNTEKDSDTFLKSIASTILFFIKWFIILILIGVLRAF